MARYIDADKLHPDKMTIGGTLAISQSQIAKQPTADVRENIHGEWMEKNGHTQYCSECGFEETIWRTSEYKFCPNCGAITKG